MNAHLQKGFLYSIHLFEAQKTHITNDMKVDSFMYFHYVCRLSHITFIHQHKEPGEQGYGEYEAKNKIIFKQP